MILIDVANIPKGVTVMQYMCLICKHFNIAGSEEIYDDSLRDLQSKGYIKITNFVEKTFDLRAKAVLLMDQVQQEEEIKEINTDIDEWIDEYRKLFKNASNFPGIMGDRSSCVKKMESFMKKYDYTKDQIINATKYYIDSVDNLKFLIHADYFIYKNRQSRLATFCEEITTEDVSISKSNTLDL